MTKARPDPDRAAARRRSSAPAADIASPTTRRSPSPARRPRPGDDVDHVLVRVIDPAAGPFPADPAALNPFVRWRTRFHAWHRARAIGWSDAEYHAFVDRLNAQVGLVDDHGFRVTPFARSAAALRRPGLLGGRRRLGEGRDRQRLRLAQGAAPLRDAARARRGGGAAPRGRRRPDVRRRAPARPGRAAGAPRHRLVRQRRAGGRSRRPGREAPPRRLHPSRRRSGRRGAAPVAGCSAHHLRARAGGPRRPDLPCAPPRHRGRRGALHLPGQPQRPRHRGR